ncbi:MAG: permease-like cell division protein FtsX [Candidatus Latescibacterota bacterium]|jgi:cell division transport system permease protein
MLEKPVYLVNEAFRTIQRHKGVTTISVIIMSLSLLMLAVFLLATDNLLKVIGQTEQEMRVYVYLKDSVQEQQIQTLHRKLLSMDEAATVVFVSREEALDEFRGDLPEEDAELLDALETNPLPNSFWINLKNEYRDKVSLEHFAGQVSQLGGVEEVRYGKDFVDKFSRIIRGVYYVDAIVGFIVILSAIFIISNAVRLTVISRRKNIEILKLVGATNRFITTPFIIEGALQGGIAAVVSLALLFALTLASRRVVPDLSFFSADKTAVYLLTCVLIGSLGSFTALRRYLKV